MTNLEFDELRDKIKEGQEVKIRYQTYNKNDYIDVFGKIISLYGRFSKAMVGCGTYYVSIEYLGTYKIHDRFTGKNHPQLRLFSGTDDESFCNMRSSQITFIKPVSIRAYKIHQLRTRNN